ncbi:metal-dependent hydrolase family protein [Sediminicola luteus]|uniref:Amidohydrolase n=1 Tax=Sediminicola luteus TaxID=319238 RepID=A0A2A4G9I3_9FLAO|nr:amidohydrolase family protein [Sediminicola luteus]PCE64646.1 amidohydrolase [Sediminicola luteus]
MKKIVLLLLCLVPLSIQAQYILKADRVFDGFEMHKDWVVVVEGERITYAGPTSKTRKLKGNYIKLPGTTLMPGIIEGHSHILLHPYNEVSWNDQVLKESPAERAIRASVHVENSLMAGITAMRDLGAEGAGYTDVYVKQSIAKGIIRGPRLMVAGPAIVATGAYGPKGFHDGVQVPLGAEPTSGIEGIITTARRQLGQGADLIKVYADYRWHPGEASQATFLQEELDVLVKTATSAGRWVVAHASTPEGMRRAVLAGVETIEHGDGGTRDIFELMKSKNVALCPTLAAGDAITQYRGWKKGHEPEPERIQQKRKSFQLALEVGVPIVFGGDVGVFTHGENYREMKLMVDYGMSPKDVLRTATSGNAEILHFKDLGQVKAGFLADLIAVKGNPTADIKAMREVSFVMLNGELIKNQSIEE